VLFSGDTISFRIELIHWFVSGAQGPCLRDLSATDTGPWNNCPSRYRNRNTSGVGIIDFFIP
jgi:hypothetical protein